MNGIKQLEPSLGIPWSPTAPPLPEQDGLLSSRRAGHSEAVLHGLISACVSKTDLTGTSG